jgi:Flp pilus assembly protein TadG
MMGRHEARRAQGNDEAGATLVEFALVMPIVFMLIFGLIAGCYLAYQDSALHDGASAGSRMASIETKLVEQQNNLYCESGKPVSIETAVAQASPLLNVNPAPLCATSPMATQLTQGSNVNNAINITVTCGGTCASPNTTAVTLTLDTEGLVAPFGLTYHLTATSQTPVLDP